MEPEHVKPLHAPVPLGEPMNPIITKQEPCVAVDLEALNSGQTIEWNDKVVIAA